MADAAARHYVETVTEGRVINLDPVRGEIASGGSPMDMILPKRFLCFTNTSACRAAALASDEAPACRVAVLCEVWRSNLSRRCFSEGWCSGREKGY